MHLSAPATVVHLELLEAARRGDEDAYGRLVGPYRAELEAHCYRMLGSGIDAEDALQEVLLRAWRALPQFEGRSSLRSWLYRIATNACRLTHKADPAGRSTGACAAWIRQPRCTLSGLRNIGTPA